MRVLSLCTFSLILVMVIASFLDARIVASVFCGLIILALGLELALREILDVLKNQKGGETK